MVRQTKQNPKKEKAMNRNEKTSFKKRKKNLKQIGLLNKGITNKTTGISKRISLEIRHT